jgi:hypothetical protein
VIILEILINYAREEKSPILISTPKQKYPPFNLQGSDIQEGFGTSFSKHFRMKFLEGSL